jgi:glutamate dehydrogenase
VISLLHAFCALDIADIADMEGRDLSEVAELYYTLNAHLGIDHLLTAISGLDAAERWTSLARLALRNDVYGAMRLLCVDVLSGSCSAESAVEKIADWENTNAARLVRARAILAETFTVTPTSIAALTVAAHQIHTMVRQLRPA